MYQTRIITAVTIAAIGGFAFWQFSSPKNVNAQYGKMPMPEVAVIHIESKPVELFEELPGRTSAFKIAEIRPQVSGIITDKMFAGGAFVEEKQQLYQIDDSPFIANLNAAKAGLLKSKANLSAIENKHKRYEELVKVEAISKQEFDDIVALLAQAKADVASSQASVDKAKIELDYTKVYAPISGKIGSSNFTQGALVTQNQAENLATITQLDPIYVDMNIPSNDLIDMRNKVLENEKLKVELTINNKKLYGMLQFSESIVDASTGSVRLRAIFTNPDGILLPGLFVHAKIKFPEKNMITIPQNATNYNPDGSVSVWVMDQKNIVNPRIITVEKAINNRWIVNSGLNIGDIIVVEGFQKIKPDAKVSPIYVVEERSSGKMPKIEETPNEAAPKNDKTQPQKQEG